MMLTRYAERLMLLSPCLLRRCLPFVAPLRYMFISCLPARSALRHVVVRSESYARCHARLRVARHYAHDTAHMRALGLPIARHYAHAMLFITLIAEMLIAFIYADAYAAAALFYATFIIFMPMPFIAAAVYRCLLFCRRFRFADC